MKKGSPRVVVNNRSNQVNSNTHNYRLITLKNYF